MPSGHERQPRHGHQPNRPAHDTTSPPALAPVVAGPLMTDGTHAAPARNDALVAGLGLDGLDLSPAAPVQRRAEPSSEGGAPTAPGPVATGPDAAVLQAATAALDAGNDLYGWLDLELEAESQRQRFFFRDDDVNKALRELLLNWAGESDLEAMLVRNSYAEKPAWIGKLRYKAMQGHESGTPDEPSALAKRMCDAVETLAGPDDENLSAGRQKLIEESRKRMGSVYGQRRNDGGVNLFDGTDPMSGDATSCGLLPGVVMSKAGVTGLITRWGVEGVRTEADKLGVWQQAVPGLLPMPGDPYLLEYLNGETAHVGIIHRIDVPDPEHGLIWETMDAGQGGAVQEAKYVKRKVERRANGIHLLNVQVTAKAGDSGGWTKLAGWVRLDDLLAKQQAQKK